MKFFHKKIFFIIFALVLSSGFFTAHRAEADTCGFSDTPTFRTTKTTTPLYQESDRPYVYIDVTVHDCIGVTITFSLVSFWTENSVDALDDQDIVIGTGTGGSENFTIVMRAGEENCEAGQPSCKYFLTAVNSDLNINLSTTGSQFISYASDTNDFNDGADWEYIAIIPGGNDYQNDPHGNPNNMGGNTVDTGPQNQSSDTGGSSVINLNLVNPIAGTIDTLPQFFQKVVYFIIKIAIPLIAIAIVYAGFLFVSARGDSSQIEKAKTTFMYAIIGGLILLASWFIADAIKDALTTIM